MKTHLLWVGALSLFFFGTVWGEAPITVQRTISGLDANGFVAPGTEELTVTLTFSRTEGGTATIRMERWGEALPPEWRYKGGSLITSPMPESIPSDDQTGVLIFEWNDLQMFPYTMSYVVRVPEIAEYPARFRGDLWFSTLVDSTWQPGNVPGAEETILLDTGEFQNIGSLVVTLGPAEAVDAGAMWRLSGSEWKMSGERCDLGSGIHRVEFKRLTGWQPVEEQDVVVASGNLKILEVTYASEIEYVVGTIPPVSVRYGESAHFRVVSPDGGALSCVVSNPPGGALVFDPSTGQFDYTPADTDQDTFTVTFISSSGTLTETQDVPVQPIAGLVPEQHIIAYQRNIPDSDSQDYLVVTDVKSLVEESFNNETLFTHAVTVSGKTVVIEEGFDKNALYEQYNDRNDIKTFAVYAETLIMRSAFALPQTAVTIYARELRFEDKPAALPTALITTPRHKDALPDQLQAGINGLDAGRVELYIERFHLDGGNTERFVLTGGTGQDGGPGKDGAQGKSIAPVYTTHEDPYVAKHCTYYCLRLLDSSCGVQYGDSSDWRPGDGLPGQPGGKPGIGGRGGDFGCTLPLDMFSAQAGGMAGTKAATAIGGAPGEPVPALRVIFNPLTYPQETRTEYSAHKGPDAPAPEPDAPAGPDGNFMPLPNPTAWFHPYMLRPVLLHAKDAYLNGNPDYTRGILEEYLGLMDLYQDEIPADQANDMAQLRTEMENLLNRIDHGLDYFGNPPGWTPMLSFESNYAMFEQEIESAIPILYLAYCLNAADQFTGDRVAALGAGRDKLKEEIAALTTSYNTAQTLIPGLQTESTNIANDISRLQARLVVVEQLLLRRAEHIVSERHKVPWWKKACKIVSFVCKLIPTPYTQVAAAGLDMALNFDGNNPLATVGQVANIFEGFNTSKIEKDATDFKTKLGELDPGNVKPEDALSYFGKLSTVAKDLSSKLAPIKDLVADGKAPKSEIEAELQKLKSADPEFNAIVNDLKELNVRKEVFALKLAEALNAVSRLANGITQNLLAVNEISETISSGLTARNHAAMVYVKEMEARTKERLLKYQYYMAKAFEYRMLQPYGGSFNLDRLREDFVDILAAYPSETGSDWERFELAAQHYEDELQQVAFEVYAALNANAPERTTETAFSLEPEELETLNTNGELSFNLFERCKFPVDRENIRIVDIKTEVLNAEVEGDPRGKAELNLTYTHKGESILESKGQFYAFQHYRTSDVNPITWGVDYDLVAGGAPTETSISAANNSLLEFLLERAGVTNPDMLLYSRPAAWADIAIKCQVTTNGPGVRIPIQALRIKIFYDYYQKSSAKASLYVEVPDGLMPYIALQAADANGRKDGRGSFYRSFDTNATVILTPEATYGSTVFVRWEDEYFQPIKVLGKSGELAITMDDHKKIRAVYASTEPLTAIPDVVGKQQYTAGMELDEAGFFLDKVSYQASLVYPGGQVISQSPVAGTLKPAGTAIALLVSSGASPVNVPDIVGMQLAEARVVLNQQGLRLGQVAFQDMEDIPVGEVMSQEPPGLVRVAPGSPVTLIVSGTAEEVPVEGEGELPVEGEGETPGEGELPVEGEGEAPGEGELPSEGEGEVPGEGELPAEGEGEVPGEGEIPAEGEGEVPGEGEAPAEGESSSEGEGEGAAVVQDVLDMTPENARAVLEGAGFVVSEASECSDTVATGAIIRQSPGAGSTVPAGSTITLVVSTGACGEDTGGCCQGGAKVEGPGDAMKRMLGDWLLVGLSLAALVTLGVAGKE